MSSMLFVAAETGFIVPGTPQGDQAVAPNFERFDGLQTSPDIGGGPLDNPAALDASAGGSGGMGTDYGATPRPGQMNQPIGQTYTPGPLQGVVGVIGGQPLGGGKVADRIHKYSGTYTEGDHGTRIQHRLGVGQAYQGIEQTVALGEITNNPPQPGDLQSIISGFG